MAAFTSVSARRTLGNPPSMAAAALPPQQPPSSQPTSEKAKQPTIFPEAVRQYVQRCFGHENTIPGVSQQEMQQRLKQVINDAAERHELNTIDWLSLPLPQQMIHEERKAAAAASARHAKPLVDFSDSVKAYDPTPSSTDKSPPKKRKSSEISRDNDDNEHSKETASPPTWRKTNARNGFEDRLSYPEPTISKRATRKERKLNNEMANFKDHSKSANDLERRRQRFVANWRGDEASSGQDSRDETPLLDVDNGPVIGTCLTLEKNYFRLTSAPKPETVRPLHVLEKSLDLLKRKWRADGNYSYICDQFKSLRQDLTVQHIRTSFTVNVYEIHARIALEKGDLGEYNQCQTQLRALYKQKLGGHPAEFLAYRILYMIYTCNRTDMNDVLADLTLADREQAAVKHALEVRSALALGNYHRFFRLYLSTPHMGGYLMDMFITRERLNALANICRAYKQIDLRFLTETLGFESDRDTAAFICDHGGAELLENKESGPSFASGKAGAMFETAKATAFRRVDIKGQI